MEDTKFVSFLSIKISRYSLIVAAPFFLLQTYWEYQQEYLCCNYVKGRGGQIVTKDVFLHKTKIYTYKINKEKAKGKGETMTISEK